MKGHYSYTQTVATGPQGTAPVEVKHDIAGAVPMTEAARLTAYLRQNRRSPVVDVGGYYEEYERELTPRQLRQLRRQMRRATCRAAKTLSPVARDMVLAQPHS